MRIAVTHQWLIALRCSTAGCQIHWWQLPQIDGLTQDCSNSSALANHPVMYHYNDIIISTTASQITSLTTVYSIVYSCADQRKHQSTASLAFVSGIHRWPVNSPAQRASNAENVSIWWRHYVQCLQSKAATCHWILDMCCLNVVCQIYYWQLPHICVYCLCETVSAFVHYSEMIIDGLAQECNDSSVLAMGLLKPSTKPSISSDYLRIISKSFKYQLIWNCYWCLDSQYCQSKKVLKKCQFIHLFHIYNSAISISQCKPAVTPLLTHWSYCSLALNHRYHNWFYLSVWTDMVWHESYTPCIHTEFFEIGGQIISTTIDAGRNQEPLCWVRLPKFLGPFY